MNSNSTTCNPLGKSYCVHFMICVVSIPASLQWTGHPIMGNRRVLVPPQKTTNTCLICCRGPGLNSSKSRNFGKIQLPLQLSHLGINLKKNMVLYGIYINFISFYVIARQLSCLCVTCLSAMV